MAIPSACLVQIIGKERPEIPATDWEPAFFDWHGRLCPELPGAAYYARMLDHLHRRIVHEPRDLLAHVRRIMLAKASQNKDQVATGLSELFDVLGEKGSSLRLRLLDLCVPMLSQREFQALSAGTKDESGGEGAALPLVFRQQLEKKLAASGNKDSLTEAAEYLENGQVDEARALLEGALLEQPDDEATARALLDIYRHSRDRRSLENMRGRLAPVSESMRHLWDDAVAEIERSE